MQEKKFDCKDRMTSIFDNKIFSFIQAVGDDGGFYQRTTVPFYI